MPTKYEIDAMVRRIKTGWYRSVEEVEHHCIEIAEERERLAAMVVEPVLVGKICPDCREDKALTSKYWHRRRSSHDGFDHRCKECKRNYDRRSK